MADPFTAVIILKGAFMFGADLIRALSRRGRHPRIEFIRLESYGDALQISGTVSLRSPRPAGIEGRQVLIVDDVFDSGLTLLEAKRLLESCGAAEIRTCVLVRKEGKQKVPLRADFVGFTIGDQFVVGYGIDCAENYRDLPLSCGCDRRLDAIRANLSTSTSPRSVILRRGMTGRGRKESARNGSRSRSLRPRSPAARRKGARDLPEAKIAHQTRERQR